MNLTLEQFDKFADLCAEQLSVTGREEYYGSDYNIFNSLINQARSSLFNDELNKQNRYKQYLDLKAEFESPLKPEGNVDWYYALPNP